MTETTTTPTTPTGGFEAEQARLWAEGIEWSLAEARRLGADDARRGRGADYTDAEIARDLLGYPLRDLTKAQRAALGAAYREGRAG